ncbi:MAG: lysine--tRNA ligase [Erysipelotrichaceae bacterium]|nr:lysine--tRNA ligase [Erysipelotrichaceae bacterium]MBQ4019331.1 lysine--tRNA ligase [Erysipelotrichaceae bacterium]MBQ5555734.1 lysine--tRNA ligase [Erysipelotrichaceae bacterium]
MERELNDQEKVRRQKMEDLRAKGIDPFGQAFERTANSKSIRDEFGEASKEELEAKNVEVKIAGRIMSKRRMGKMCFMHVLDKDGQIQLVINKADVGEEAYELVKASDIGDIIGLKGIVYRTNPNDNNPKGELSVYVKEYTHLSKALRPLPEKFHGLTDVEERYRRRYVDLIMNDESRRIAFLRPQIIRAIQHNLDSQGLVEVETPVLNPILGGANARPFTTHHNALNKEFYLRIATELYLKRLIVGGMEGVYEIGRLFRNEGMDLKHNPEFTTVEAYVAYSDLEGMMKLCENLFEEVSTKVLGTTELQTGDHTISLKAPFKRVNMTDAVNEKTGKDFRNITLEEAEAVCKELHIELEKHEMDLGHIINKLFEELCEEDMVGPVFVYGHPLEISPLAKKDPNDPRFTLRFELYINGTEYANAFTELNDPIDQYERFENQLKAKELGDDEATEMDIDYVEALEYGMPPTGGIGIGIDRFVMLLAGTDSIREVLLFPTMKPREGEKNTVRKIENTEEVIDFSKVEIEPLFEDMVDFDTFSKSDFRAVKVLACEAVPKSKKLLKFTLNDGTGTPRTILSGIHEYYEPEELVGKTCIAIVNLPPRAMMGIDSCGMLISAVHHEEGQEKLHLLQVDPHIPAGAKLY